VLQILIGSTVADTASVASIRPLVNAVLSLSRVRRSHDCWNTSSNQPAVCCFTIDKFGKLSRSGLGSTVKQRTRGEQGDRSRARGSRFEGPCNDYVGHLQASHGRLGLEVHVTRDKAASFEAFATLCNMLPAAICLSRVEPHSKGGDRTPRLYG
jgi:hypothetical protein